MRMESGPSTNRRATPPRSAGDGLHLLALVFQTLSLGLEEGHADSRAHEFVTRFEGAVSEKLAKAPQRMALPLARLAFSKT